MTAQRKPARRFRIETECINSLIEAGVTLRVPVAFAQALRLSGYILSDVRLVLAQGRVVRSDMDEDMGLWDVRGLTIEGAGLTVRVRVDSAEEIVELVHFR